MGQPQLLLLLLQPQLLLLLQPQLPLPNLSVKRTSSQKAASATPVLQVTRVTERKKLRKRRQHAKPAKSHSCSVRLVLVVTIAQTALLQKMGYHPPHHPRKRKTN